MTKEDILITDERTTISSIPSFMSAITEDDVLITDELWRRSPRPPNLESENQILRDLGRQLTKPTQILLKYFTKIAKDLCQAGTAGVSLIDLIANGQEIFRWDALSGAYEEFEGGTTPRDLSICGVCLRRGSPQLYSYPARYFTYLQDAEPIIVEGLVVPLLSEGQELGTIWILSHDEQRQFDSEDLRVMTSLADFLAAAISNAQMRQMIEENARREQTAHNEKVCKSEERFRTLVNPSSQMLYRMSPDWSEMRKLQGGNFIADTEELSRDWLQKYIHPDDQKRVLDAIGKAIRNKSIFELEHQVRRKDGTFGWVYSHAAPLLNAVGEINEWFGEASDITERKWAELLLVEQKRLLELTASGIPMDECLSSLCASVSKLNWGIRACILLTDAQRLTFPRSITPGFVQSFGQGLKDAPINELAIGTCGTAVYRGQPITCADIANDNQWSKEWRDLCVAHGILACHSAPVLGADGLPFGSLMLCFNEARLPTDWEYRLVEFGTQVASIVFERERSILARQESEERYRTLFESIDEGFCVIEVLFDENDIALDYRFLEVNPAFEKQTGLVGAEGKTARQLVPDLEEHWVEIYGKVALTGESLRFENGSKAINRWFDVYAFRIGEPQSRKVVLLFNEISARRRSEALLRESEERFRHMADNAPVMVWVTDSNSYCTYLSRSWYNFTGQTEETGLGLGWLDVVHPEDKEVSKNIFLDANDRKGAFQLEYRLRRKDGEYRTCIDSASPWFGINGQFKGYIGSVIDITERKQAELQLQQQARGLTQLNQSLTQTSELLAERNQELNSFTYIVSHDLKAPLRAIANLSQWLEDDLEGQLDEDKHQQMQLLRNRVGRMEAMIDGLLAYSRVGRTEVEPETVNVGALLNEIIDSLAPPPTFTINIQSVPTIVARRLLLSQVFSNLIGNAIKHHPRLDGRIEISATQKGQFYEFAIADDGNGIAPEDREKIFGIFQTLNSRDVKESTGVGLTIVKKIVETEGGKITVDSELGSGATFRFTWLKYPATTREV